MPYFAGLLASHVPRLDSMPIDEVLLVHLDRRGERLRAPAATPFPRHMGPLVDLERHLLLICGRFDNLGSRGRPFDAEVGRAFLRFFVDVFRDYSWFLGKGPAPDPALRRQPVHFDFSGFVARLHEREPAVAQFVADHFRSSQMFDAFLGEREQLAKTAAVADHFELAREYWRRRRLQEHSGTGSDVADPVDQFPFLDAATAYGDVDDSPDFLEFDSAFLMCSRCRARRPPSHEWDLRKGRLVCSKCQATGGTVVVRRVLRKLLARGGGGDAAANDNARRRASSASSATTNVRHELTVAEESAAARRMAEQALEMAAQCSDPVEAGKILDAAKRTMAYSKALLDREASIASGAANSCTSNSGVGVSLEEERQQPLHPVVSSAWLCDRCGRNEASKSCRLGPAVLTVCEQCHAAILEGLALQATRRPADLTPTTAGESTAATRKPPPRPPKKPGKGASTAVAT